MDIKQKVQRNEERQDQIWAEHNAPKLHCKLRAVRIRYTPFIHLEGPAKAKAEALFDQLYQGKRIHNRKQWLLNMETLLANLVTNKRKFFSVSLNVNYWIKNQYRKPSAKTIDLIKDMAREGYIEMHKGKGNEQTEFAYNTKIRATDRLLKSMKLLPEQVLYAPPLLVVRSEENKRLLPYKETIATKRIKKILTKANEVNGKAKIFHKNTELDTRMTAIFTEKTSLHGRLYTSGSHHQGIPEKERAEITINGDPVIELDYSGLHPNLLYAKEGIQADGDPYQKLFPDPERVCRDFLKKALLSLINSQGCWSPKKPKPGQKQYWRTARLNAVAGIDSRLRPDGKIKGRIRKIYKPVDDDELYQRIEELTGVRNELNDIRATRAMLEEHGIENGKDVVAAFEKAHPEIAHYFCSENKTGMKLMNLDGQIALNVVNHFIKQGIPILAIHDSFIVQQQYRNELEQAMQTCYQKKANGKWIKIKPPKLDKTPKSPKKHLKCFSR